MDRSILHNEIEILLGKIRQRHEGLKDLGGKISKLELDLLLSDLRTIYEFCEELSKSQNEGEIIADPVEEKTKAPEQPAEEIPSVPKVNAPSSLFDDFPTVAEKFSGKTTVRDRLSENREDKSIAGKLKNKPIKDLRSAIGINEKFIFLNELFDGNANGYNDAVDALNGFSSFEEANNYLENSWVAKYNWNLKNKYVKGDFMDLVHRRFL